MKIIVQKFGGTSVTSSDKRNIVIDKVIDAVERGYSPVVVVSAIGRQGDAYATDTLLSLINASESSLEDREKDLLMCCGEIISAVVLAEAFSQRGYKTRVLTGGNAGIITDSNHGNAKVVNVETKRILGLLRTGIIPIVAGFQGVTEEGDFTTLGRGGSDITGALLGMALKAECTEIYTDVDGIMTADPRIVPDAKVIDEISYDEVYKFADQGAKVVHPRAVEFAMKGGFPLIIKNTASNAPGTVINTAKKDKCPVITGITGMTDRAQITLNITKSCSDMGNRVFELLAQKNIIIDLLKISESEKVFTVRSEDKREVEHILKQISADYKIINNCSKIAVIGNNLKNVPGIMSRILKILEGNHIDLLQAADSDSGIWCLIKKDDNVKAISELHKAFFNNFKGKQNLDWKGEVQYEED